jgi:hypothetical protein
MRRLLDWLGRARSNNCPGYRGSKYQKFKILNRVSTKSVEISKAEYHRTMTHVAPDAV